MEVTMEVTMEEKMEETVVEETSFVEDMAVADETFLNLEVNIRKKYNLMNLQRGRHQKNKQPPKTECYILNQRLPEARETSNIAVEETASQDIDMDVTVEEIEMNVAVEDIDMDETSLNLQVNIPNHNLMNLQRGRHQKNKQPPKKRNQVRDQRRAEAREKKKTAEAERAEEKQKERDKKKLQQRKIRRLDKKQKAKLRRYYNYSSTI